jgi:hypothetical protein
LCSRRYDRDKLYEEVWERPMKEVAADYGVSGVALGKMCKKLFIPLPGRGYWNKKNAGRPVPRRPPLPSLDSWVKS